jgi:hypothetical protein
MTHAQRIIKDLGGPSFVALETGIPIQTVSDWGVNGNIPHWRRDGVLALVRRLDKQLAPELVTYLASRAPAPKAEDAAEAA